MSRGLYEGCQLGEISEGNFGRRSQEALTNPYNRFFLITLTLEISDDFENFPKNRRGFHNVPVNICI